MNQQPPGQPRKTRRAQNGDMPLPGPPQPPEPSQYVPQPAQIVPSQPVPPGLDVLQAEFEALVASNQARFAELAASGASPDPLYLVHARINHLIDMIASATGPNGPRWAMMTRIGFERSIAGDLEQAGPATRRMQLAEGGRYTPEMIRQLARQTRTLQPRTH